MTNLKNSPESQNFEDHTAYTPLENFLDGLLVKINPVYAVRNVRARLIENGQLNPPPVDRVGGAKENPGGK